MTAAVDISRALDWVLVVGAYLAIEMRGYWPYANYEAVLSVNYRLNRFTATLLL
jgi:hypothetical protein